MKGELNNGYKPRRVNQISALQEVLSLSTTVSRLFSLGAAMNRSKGNFYLVFCGGEKHIFNLTRSSGTRRLRIA